VEDYNMPDDGGYTGKRFTYGLTHAKVSYVPPWNNYTPDWIIGSEGEHKDYPYGTIDYSYKLEEMIARDRGMVLIAEGTKEPKKFIEEEKDPRCTCDETYEVHPCPFGAEVYDDPESMCTCCPYCTNECAENI
jgi:hypothetical protein